MITAETVNGIVKFEANGLPVVSLYCGVGSGESRRELRARVDSLLDQIRPLAKDGDFDPRHRLSVRADIKRIKDATSSERWPAGTSTSCRSSSGSCRATCTAGWPTPGIPLTSWMSSRRSSLGPAARPGR
jgi:hypothetical protein